MHKEIRFWIEDHYLAFNVNSDGRLLVTIGIENEIGGGNDSMSFEKYEADEILRSLDDLFRVESWQTKEQ